MRKQILTDNETKTFLMKTFKCSRQAVWQALNFVRDSDQARRIRTLALKRGGKLTDGNFIPNCETTFEECEHTMTCTFGPPCKTGSPPEDQRCGRVRGRKTDRNLPM